MEGFAREGLGLQTAPAASFRAPLPRGKAVAQEVGRLAHGAGLTGLLGGDAATDAECWSKSLPERR